MRGQVIEHLLAETQSESRKCVCFVGVFLRNMQHQIFQYKCGLQKTMHCTAGECAEDKSSQG